MVFVAVKVFVLLSILRMHYNYNPKRISTHFDV